MFIIPKRRNFKIIKKGVKIDDLIEEYNKNIDLLSKDRAKMSMHRETEAVSLATVWSTRITKNIVHHGQELIVCKEIRNFPKILEFIKTFAEKQNSQISKVTIVSLKGSGNVYRHYDFGGYFILRNRFHLVLKSEGTLMETGGEELLVKMGDFFYINNRQFHSVSNLGESDRVHIIFDLLPKSVIKRVAMLLLWGLHERKIQHESINEKGNDWSYNLWRTILFGQKFIDQTK